MTENNEINGVLVVDDDNSIRQLVGSALSRAGFNVTLAANGRIGVEHVRAATRPFGLILMDHHMPEMDGLKACRVMRSCAPDTPIIMMSTDQLSPVVREAGADDFLPKPFAIRELINCINKHIDS
ncbi:MAG: response regulator transcription factor [Gammaproteobacteria bacterium]|nr:response regulator transcription factor [Gammaproteobacteria bacterium]